MWSFRRRSPAEKFLAAGGGSSEELERLMAEEGLVEGAEAVRFSDKLAGLAFKRLLAAYRSGDAARVRLAEDTHRLARELAEDPLSQHPELADRELVRQLAPTWWERLGRRLLPPR